MIKSYLPLLLVFLTTSGILAQKKANTPHQRWEMGLMAGIAQGQTDLNDLSQFENNFGGGMLVRYHVDDVFALRANILYAEITGDDAHYPKRVDRGFRFSAPLTEGALVAELDLLGKRRWKDGTFHRMVSPYIFGGIGYALTKPSTNYNETANLNMRDQIAFDKNNLHEGHLVVPMGIGAKIDLGPSWVLGVETGVRLLFNDYLDGVSQSGNPRKNDTYTITTISATYRFPYASDRDHDGIPDTEDACPEMKGPASTKGCPDTDGDGVADKFDNCPNERGAPSLGGCPDNDGDGIANNSDKCPDIAGSLATAGCPDKDKDGIADADDACPDEKGLAKFQGCPDSDGDGIKDSEDKCPNQAGTIENKGCPVNDRDRDGVLDADDKCPDIAGSAAFSGCPDTDGDGIGDHQDKCPDIAGPASNKGCPEITETDKKVLSDAIYGVQFESAKSVLKISSNNILDQVADVMARNPQYGLTISGHTDSDGSEASNQRLSEARAKACFEYLANKGVARSRMSASGFGETQPVADNSTKAGKAQNRRVEFQLSLL